MQQNNEFNQNQEQEQQYGQSNQDQQNQNRQQPKQIAIQQTKLQQPRKKIFVKKATVGDISKRSKLQKLDEKDYGDPDLKAAHEYAEGRSFRRVNEYGELEMIPLCTNITEFGQFGAAVQLYFQFLKCFSFVFLIMFIVSSYGLMLNFTSNGFAESEATVLLKTTLGNQQMQDITGSVLDTKSVSEQEIQVGAETLLLGSLKSKITIIRLLDFLSIILFMFFLWIYKKRSAYYADEIEKAAITTSDYTLFVTGFPKTGVKASDLKKHFSQYDKIIEVEFAYNFQGTLFQFQGISELGIKKKLEEWRMRKNPRRSNRKLKKIKTKIKVQHTIIERRSKFFEENDIKSLEDYPTLGAYVVFDSFEKKDMTNIFYRQLHKPQYCRYICFCCFCCFPKKIIPYKHLFLGRYLLTLDRKVEEPSNIKWENLDVGAFEFGFRRFIVYISLVFVILISFILLMIGTAITMTDVKSKCEQWPFIVEENLNDLLLENNTDRLECFCSAQGLNALKKENKVLFETCQQYLSLDVFMPQIIAFVGSFIITIVNMIVKKLIKKFTDFSRFKSVSEESTSVIQTVFITQFINTALLPFLVVLRFQNFIPTIKIMKLIGLGSIVSTNENNYIDDMNRDFYAQVGTKYILTYIIMTFNPHIINCLVNPCVRCSRRKKGRKAVIHKDAKKYLTGPTFEIVGKFAGILNIVFMAVCFSAGFPLLLLLTCIILYTTFLVEKYMVIKYNSKPVSIDKQPNDLLIGVLPYSVLFHCLFAILMFSTPQLFPQEKESDGTSIVKIFANRVNHPNSYIFVIYALLYIVYKVLQGTVFKVIIIFLKTLCCCFCCKKEDEEEYAEGQGTYTEELPTIKNAGLETYDIIKNEEYTDIIKAVVEFTRERAQSKRASRRSQS